MIRAPADWAQLGGRRLRLDWHDPLLAPLAMDVHFSDEAMHSVVEGGVHPLRLNHWRQVTPLESLAGARPRDDQLVRLPAPVRVLPPEPERAGATGQEHDAADAGLRLLIVEEPLQTTGTAMALVRFEAPQPTASDASVADAGVRNGALAPIDDRAPDPPD